MCLRGKSQQKYTIAFIIIHISYTHTKPSRRGLHVLPRGQAKRRLYKHGTHPVLKI